MQSNGTERQKTFAWARVCIAHMPMQFSGLHTNLEMFHFHDSVHYLFNWTHVKFVLLGLGYWFGVTGVCFS